MTALPVSFRHLAWSNLAAQSAEQIALAAVPILAVLALGAGEAATGFLQAAATLPFVLVAIPAGVLVDRLSRRTLMAGAEALRAAALAAILLLMASGQLALWSLGLLSFIAVCGTVVFSVAAPALVPQIVGPDRLPEANARIELARTVAFAGGPALGGALVAWIGFGFAFGLATSLSVIAVLLILRIAEPAPAAARKRHPWQDIREGASFVWDHALLRPVFVTQLIFGIGAFMILAVYVPFAVHRLGLSATGIGITLGLYGAGMMVGALLATRVIRRLPFGTVVGIGPVTGLVASAAMALTTLIPSPALAGLGFFLLGAGPILWVISTTTLRQAVTPPHLLGRVSAINVLAYGARPIGAGLGGLIGGLYGAGTCFWIAVMIFAAQAALILLSPVVHLDRQPTMNVEPASGR